MTSVALQTLKPPELHSLLASLNFRCLAKMYLVILQLIFILILADACVFWRGGLLSRGSTDMMSKDVMT